MLGPNSIPVTFLPSSPSVSSSLATPVSPTARWHSRQPLGTRAVCSGAALTSLATLPAKCAEHSPTPTHVHKWPHFSIIGAYKTFFCKCRSRVACPNRFRAPESHPGFTLLPSVAQLVKPPRSQWGEPSLAVLGWLPRPGQAQPDASLTVLGIVWGRTGSCVPQTKPLLSAQLARQ